MEVTIMKVITKLDLAGARLTMKNSINPKEIENAQRVIRQYKEQQERIRKEK